MGLFMDGSGIPLAFSIFDGNKNEQPSLQPLEKQILNDFGLSKFIVCTDAGLASNENRLFNDVKNRAFITTQSIKKLNKGLMEWALEKTGWLLSEKGKKVPQTYDISQIDEETHFNSVFYKERWEVQYVNMKNEKTGATEKIKLEQRYIVTYSIKYRNYQRHVREGQIERARKLTQAGGVKLKKVNANDYRRFIKKVSTTGTGEIAEKELYFIDEEVIAGEKKYDGFYGVCTNLEDDVEEIIKVNHGRWEIEECFRIMKSEFLARPVYLSNDDRIKAHFMTCFLALVLYRLLERKLGLKYTCSQIISQLREMNFVKVKDEGYAPCYTRTDFTDDLHDAFGFRTDVEILTRKFLKKIFKTLKN
jgi:transposase